MEVLNNPVLVLNKSWVPINVVTARTAITKMFEGAAKAVTDDYSVYDFESWADLSIKKDEPYITTAKTYIRVPNVILLVRYGEIHNKVAFSRANIYKRDNYTCQYCGVKPGTEELTIDHVTPKSKKGQTIWTNCVVSCIGCNRRKANKTPIEAGMDLLKEPVKPNWSIKMVLRKVRNTPKNWDKFVSDAYWNTELED